MISKFEWLAICERDRKVQDIFICQDIKLGYFADADRRLLIGAVRELIEICKKSADTFHDIEFVIRNVFNKPLTAECCKIAEDSLREVLISFEQS